MLNEIKRFMAEEEGLTAIEYCVAGGLVIATLVAAFGILGTSATTVINGLITAIGGTPA